MDLFEGIVYGFGGTIAGLSAILLMPCVIYLILNRGESRKEIRTGICIECGASRPLIQLPTRPRQVLRGGWICRECGFEMDEWGRRVAEQNTLAKWVVLRAAKSAEAGGHQQPSHSERIQEANDRTQRGDAP